MYGGEMFGRVTLRDYGWREWWSEAGVNVRRGDVWERNATLGRLWK
jgi:hypothetical protein